MKDESKEQTNEIHVEDNVTKSSQRSDKLSRIWLIVLTTLASLVCLLTGIAALATSAVLLFLFDDPDLTDTQALLIQVGVWLITLILVSLLIFGVVGGWRAFRGGNRQQAVKVSLLALPPIFFCFLGILFLIFTRNPVLTP